MSSRKKIEWYACSPLAFGDVVSPREGDTQGSAFLGQKAQLFLHGVCKKFIDGIPQIQADKNLSQDGINEKISELATACLTEIGQKKATFLSPLQLKFKVAAGNLFNYLFLFLS